jgi:hypothetical protein
VGTVRIGMILVHIRQVNKLADNGVAIPNLIAYWESVLNQYQFVMNVSTQALVESTIRVLKKMHELEKNE